MLFYNLTLYELHELSQRGDTSTARRAEANERDGIKMKQKFPTKLMAWLGVCSKRVARVVIFDEGTMDHAEYIQKVLPIALN